MYQYHVKHICFTTYIVCLWCHLLRFSCMVHVCITFQLVHLSMNAHQDQQGACVMIQSCWAPYELSQLVALAGVH